MSEDAPVNTGAVAWPDDYTAGVMVRSMQAKLHRWAGEDLSRRFGDLFNLVYDPAFLVHAWERVSTNKGARTAGIDKATAAMIETSVGVVAFLGQIRDSLKSGEFGPVEVRRVMIPKGTSGKFRKLGIPTVRRRIRERADDLEELHDRARPAMRKDERKGIGVARAHMKEVNAETVDGGPVLAQSVQPSFQTTPVVFRGPIQKEITHAVGRRALGPVAHRFFIRRRAPAKRFLRSRIALSGTCSSKGVRCSVAGGRTSWLLVAAAAIEGRAPSHADGAAMTLAAAAPLKTPRRVSVRSPAR